jgi:hypothetical protein
MSIASNSPVSFDINEYNKNIINIISSILTHHSLARKGKSSITELLVGSTNPFTLFAKRLFRKFEMCSSICFSFSIDTLSFTDETITYCTSSLMICTMPILLNEFIAFFKVSCETA